MDRNLGALDDRYHAAAEIKAKYYQFGRKDPFNSDIYCWAYNADTFAPAKTATASGMVTKTSKTIIDGSEAGGYNTGGKNVPFSVNKPATFITGSPFWSSTNDIFGGAYLDDNKTTKYWNDPRPFIRIENEETSINIENKSFFDPCPLGWRLPVNGWARGFRGDASGSATGDVNMNFQYGVDSEFKDRGKGRTYVPLGYLYQKDNIDPQTIFFPILGQRSYYSGNFDLSYSYYWSATPHASNNNDAYYLMFRSSVLNPSENYYRAYGNSIRCIKQSVF